ncbi:MAG TPA: pyridoxamine 5'-phosphate oxidase family protein [Gemmatimonadales bacterium]|nr:pyridoxamine 5'-phosphate oxidase family protein [Gemmatimonadales bacterium]
MAQAELAVPAMERFDGSDHAAGLHAQFHVRPAALAELRRLIRRSRVALVTTRDMYGALHTSPMVPSDRQFDGELWFAASASSPIVDHVLSSADVQVTFPGGRSGRCLVLDGIGHVCRGAELARALWQAELSTIFPRGPVDKGLVFVRVRVMSGDVWE